MGACLGSCAAACTFAACAKLCSCTCGVPPRLANLFYCALIVAATVTALLFRYNKVDMHVCVGLVNDCSDTAWTVESAYSYELCKGDTCHGIWSAYRISLAVSSLFALLSLFTAYPSKFAADAHCGYWYGKTVFVAGMIVAVILMPNDVFAYYAWVARFVAPLFLVYQMIFFIDFGYRMNTALVSWDEPPERRFLCFNNESQMVYKRILLLLSASLYMIQIAGWVLMYHYFPQDCAFNPVAITFAMVFAILNTAISISKIAPHGALFTSALVSTYCTWLAYSAISSMPSTSCNPLAAEPTPAQTGINIGLAGASMAWIAYTVGSRNSKDNHKVGVPAQPDQVTVKIPDEEPVGRSYGLYHLMMLLLCVYMAMLLTNWASQEDDPINSHSSGLASAWVQLGSSWLCSLFYFWTLIAPKCCPNRDFGI